MYLISIIMPIYNAEDYLDRSINSIINQTIGFENIELILVDDNSSDSSREIIKEYAKKYSNIVPFFSDKNHGYPGYGRNTGIKNSNAEYIMFIDNDDEYDPKLCEIVYNAIENGDYDTVSTNYKFISADVPFKEDCFSKIETREIIDDMKMISLDEFFKVTDPIIWTKIFKKSIIIDNEVCFFEDRLNEDLLFLYNYYLHAETLVYINYYGYTHYLHGSNLSKTSSKTVLGFINSYYDVLEFVEKNYENIDLNNIFKDKIDGTFFRIILSTNKKCLLENLYKFEKRIGFNGKLDNKFAQFCNYLLLNKKCSLLLIILNFVKVIKRILDYTRILNLYRKLTFKI